MLKLILLDGYFCSAIQHLLSIIDLKIEWVVSAQLVSPNCKSNDFSKRFPSWLANTWLRPQTHTID